MSGTSSTTNTVSADSRERWADLDRQNERLVDATHPLLIQPRRDQADNAEVVQAVA
jgi:hypothetical protein